MDTGVLAAIIVASASAIGTVINTLHINKCHSCCMDSDCRKSPPSTPIMINQPKIKNENTTLI